MLLGAHPAIVQEPMPGEILPQGTQQKVTLSLCSKVLVGWRSLLRQRLERRERGEAGEE